MKTIAVAIKFYGKTPGNKKKEKKTDDDWKIDKSKLDMNSK